MPGEEAHRGAEAPGFTATRADARVDRLTELLFEVDPAVRAVHRPLHDHTRALQLLAGRLDRPPRLVLGTVVHAVPHLNWYKVQVGAQGGWLGCRRGLDSGVLPLGPRVGNAVPSGSRVLVYRDADADLGTILCVLPHALEDGRVAVPTWLAQGGASGLRREAAHAQLFKGLFNDGGVQDFSCMAPVDATALDLCWVTETGLAILLSPYEVMLRVSELCGLHLNYFDHRTDLVGWQLALTSAAHELWGGHDEGECRFREMVALYPWEAAGQYAPGGDAAAEFDDAAVHYELHKGKVDLPDGAEDAQPAYRGQRYGGYEGQGGLRLLVRPGGTAGPRLLRDAAREPDHGLFTESVAATGAYLLASAKSVVIAKRCGLTAPRQRHPDDSGLGDDAAADNYRFSSQFGAAAPHQIGDVDVSGERQGLRRVAGVRDLIAHAVNWQRLHPFHYRADYAVPQASGAGPLGAVADPLDFAAAAEDGYLADAEAVFLHIDHRYNDVAYYRRESFLALLEDGNVVLSGGCGEELAFVNGKARISAPAGVEVVAGRDVVVLGAGVVIKAQDSVDISSSRKDLRLWAHQNLQVGAGGTLLLESKGADPEQDYRNKIGEDVRGGGVFLKSAGVLAAVGASVYARSTAGDLVLDAARMDGRVLVVAAGLDCLVADAVGVYHFSGIDGAAQASHRFAAGGAEHQGSLTVGASAYFGVVEAGTVRVNGSVAATRNVAAGGSVADARGLALGKVPDTFAADVEADLQELGAGVRATTEAADALKAERLDATWYAPRRVGNDDTIADVGYSHRDGDDPGGQYGTRSLAFLEGRWQATARLGGGTGGVAWEENPVPYQGRQLYPWPGRRKWAEDAAFYRLAGYSMFDVAGGADRDRPGPYEAAAAGAAEPVTLAEGFTIIPHP